MTEVLFYQRVRWASKTSSYQSNFGKALGLLVLPQLVLVDMFWTIIVLFLFK
jgi:hypothetical protein